MADLDFTDDIALFSDAVEQAQEILHQVQAACKRVGLGLNAKRTKYLTYNILSLDVLEGTQLERQKVFKYLGS